jgi:hypothetical protein
LRIRRLLETKQDWRSGMQMIHQAKVQTIRVPPVVMNHLRMMFWKQWMMS